MGQVVDIGKFRYCLIHKRRHSEKECPGCAQLSREREKFMDQIREWKRTIANRGFAGVLAK
jgi:hypothetical protein